MEIKAIFFDWGGVLIENPEPRLTEFCARRLNVSVHEFKTVFANYENMFQKGNIHESDLWTICCRSLEINSSLNLKIWNEAVIYAFRDKHESFELVRLLKANADYKLGFLSNTEIPAVKYFLSQHYDRYFDAMIFSCFEKATKPEEKIYKIALDKLGLVPQEAVLIDDKPDNIATARRLGIYGIVFQNIEQVKDDMNKLGICLQPRIYK
jgi:putative hydrolase of the HAD superfamily